MSKNKEHRSVLPPPPSPGLMDRLPEHSFAIDRTAAPGERIIRIKRGELGYYKTDLDSADYPMDDVIRRVDRYNERLGVSAEQAAAMQHGSMFGFDTPGADPQKWVGRCQRVH